MKIARRYLVYVEILGADGLQQRSFRLCFFNTRAAQFARSGRRNKFLFSAIGKADEGAGSTCAPPGVGAEAMKFGNYVINVGARRGRDARADRPLIGRRPPSTASHGLPSQIVRLSRGGTSSARRSRAAAITCKTAIAAIASSQPPPCRARRPRR